MNILSHVSRIVSVTLIALVAIGCSSYSNKSPMPSISESAQKELNKPTNCSTAYHDIKILEEERASVAKRMLSGVRSVMPISVVAGLLMGDYSDRVSVAAGQYNKDIDLKVKDIKAKCGIV